MRVVLDTNVVVSGLLTPHGVCAEIIDNMRMRTFRLCADGRILAEYAEVISRVELSLPAGLVKDFLDFAGHRAEHIDAMPLDISLPDESDRPFIEVAASAEAILVTGNIRHYPQKSRRGLNVVKPAEFMDMLRTEVENRE